MSQLYSIGYVLAPISHYCNAGIELVSYGYIVGDSLRVARAVGQEGLSTLDEICASSYAVECCVTLCGQGYTPGPLKRIFQPLVRLLSPCLGLAMRHLGGTRSWARDHLRWFRRGKAH